MFFVRIAYFSVFAFLCSSNFLSAASIFSRVECGVGLIGGGSLVQSDQKSCSLGDLTDIQQPVANASIEFDGVSFAGGNLAISAVGRAEAGFGSVETAVPTVVPAFVPAFLPGAATFDFTLSFFAVTQGPIRAGVLDLFIFAEVDSLDGFGVAAVEVAGQSVSATQGIGGGSDFSGTIPITLGASIPVWITLRGEVRSEDGFIDSRPASLLGGVLVSASASDVDGLPVPIGEVPEPSSHFTLFTGLIAFAAWRRRPWTR